nr:hypothetical protein [Tanacetum cinerariifolium]
MATERLDTDLQSTPTDQTTYCQMIGGIMYLTTSRPDIAYATFVCAHYQARLTVNHLKEVKQIFRYLRQSYNKGLWYSKDSGFELITYSDTDHAGCKDDCKSTSGGLQFLVIWMRTQLLDYGYKYNQILMYYDSKSAIVISRNPVQHSKTKHIDMRYHFIKEHVEKGTVELYFVGTEYQLADLFTKALTKECFEYLVHRIELLWEGIHYSLLHLTSLIPYPRFTKIIIGHYMTNFPEISRLARDKYHNLKDDDLMKNIFNSGRDKDKVGMKIPDWMISEEMKQTKHYPMYTVKCFNTINCDSSSYSLTKIHTSYPPTPVPTVDKADKLILQDTLQVSLAKDKSRQEQEARENVALLEEHLAYVEIKKMVEGQENVIDDSSIPRNVEHNIPGTRLEPNSDKESLEVEFTDVEIPMNFYDEEEEEDEITDEELGREHKFITKIIARRANECIMSIIEPDFKNLNKNDIEDMYLLIMNGKKVNLTAPTISFLEIEKHEMFSIIYEHVHGIIYKNSKKEKRAMRHSEIHKFCDATLNRVLEGLKSYNNDVNPYRTHETIFTIGIPEEIQEDKGDMNDGCDITVEDVERLRKILTPSIHTLPVQPYIPLGLVYNKAKVLREGEQDHVMQPLTP